MEQKPPGALVEICSRVWHACPEVVIFDCGEAVASKASRRSLTLAAKAGMAAIARSVSIEAASISIW